jgi:hypothetical protein
MPADKHAVYVANPAKEGAGFLFAASFLTGFQFDRVTTRGDFICDLLCGDRCGDVRMAV